MRVTVSLIVLCGLECHSHTIDDWSVISNYLINIDVVSRGV